MALGQTFTEEANTLFLRDSATTEQAGFSLAKTLYAQPLTIFLSGELGAGKTTFLKGFAKGLGIDSPLTSPTFALEQRYQTASHGELLHIDLFRLLPNEATELIEHSNDFVGIRCIEWPERLPPAFVLLPHIRLQLTEKEDGRELRCTFADIPLPSKEIILEWRKEVMLPPHIADHCDAVAAFSVQLAKKLHSEGKLVRTVALERAGMCHDLLRFLDFREGAGPAEVDDTLRPEWENIRTRFPGLRHEAAVTGLLQEKGYVELAKIVETHGLSAPPSDNATIEQMLLYYADKRAKVSTIVSLEERIRDLEERYSKTGDGKKYTVWYDKTRAMERALFPDGPPFLD